MSQEAFTFDVARLADAGRLRQSGLLLPGARSLKLLRQAMQQLADRCGRQVWLIAVPPAGETPIRALFGLQILDPQSRRALVHLYPDDAGLTADLLQAITDQAFLQQDLFRLEFEIGRTERDWLPVLQVADWQEEGCLRSCRLIQDSKRHEDVLMYSLLRPQQKTIGTAFVPFSKGVLALRGDDQGLQATYFAHYRQPVDGSCLQEVAEWLGILDEQGRLADRPALLARLGGQAWIGTEQAPAAVLAAAAQVADYFAGKRQSFDLPVHLNQGSPFQQRVWLALQTIPYGTTWTYEDLANSLGQDDRAAARKMARAVGSACGANPLPLILPCHRVIGKNGRLVGFSGGLDIKEYLLAHEIMGMR